MRYSHTYNFDYWTTGTGGYYSTPGFQKPRPYKWPEPPEQFPQIQEGDKGQIIIRQASLGWREKAIYDIVRQVEEREQLIGCRFEVTGENLPDGSLLVSWHRNACAGIPGGGK